MLHAKHLPYHFSIEAMNIVCYIDNRVTLRTITSTTLYELWKGRKPTVKYFHVFGSKCYILDDREQRRKMDPKSDEGIFLEYYINSRAYKVFNSRTKAMIDYINVVVDDNILEKGTYVESYVETSFQQINLTENEEVIESDSESEMLNLIIPKSTKVPSSEYKKTIQ